MSAAVIPTHQTAPATIADVFSFVALLASVKTAAQRVGVTERAMRALVERERILAFEFADVHIVYWPSVVDYYWSRNIPVSQPTTQ